MSTATPTKAPVYDNREAFADELCALAREDERIVVVCNDSVGSSKLGGFREEFGPRLVNVGIAEQNMVGVGAGLANGGLVPFVSSAAPFLTGRSLEQVKADIAYSQYPVILCGQSTGMAYGELGPTHHSVEDLSWLRALPGLDIVVPADRAETRQAVRLAAARPGPTYIRVGRFKVPDVTPEGHVLERGRWSILREGADVALVATGTMVHGALVAAETLAASGIEATVVNAAYIAPLDLDLLDELAGRVEAIVSVEEATLSGGLGAAVASRIAQRPTTRPAVRLLGVHDEFAPTGSNEFLLDYFGLTPEKIVEASTEALRHA
ncbi:transketolase family protein [Pseudactinotalea sp. HY158]|uniref:transketolase family protein n=1 Tax=Pseudactinotalea sp. HY158 TaxID=2654547 RepID=UPI00129C1EF4|nr:transketolase C-terminal domain-containing protein [Pseudactinotalea sp. HY158]QGH69708.1 transketolase family protein [Pseudactinotalea sp. HY158]